MRLFFGLEPDPATAVAIADWRDRQFPGLGRPVPPANLHITLAFVGEVPAPALERLCEAVDRCLAAIEAPEGYLRLDRTGYWPRPGIYWVGPTQWSPALDALARSLMNIGARVGNGKKRDRFIPHMTLFRSCQQAPPAPAVEPDVAFRFDRVTLFESRQTRNGVSYHALQDWELSPR